MNMFTTEIEYSNNGVHMHIIIETVFDEYRASIKTMLYRLRDNGVREESSELYNRLIRKIKDRLDDEMSDTSRDHRQITRGCAYNCHSYWIKAVVHG